MINVREVKMESGRMMLEVKTPYNPNIPPKLRAMGGVWNNETRAWYVPTDLRDAVKDVCMEVYGINPFAESPGEQVTLVVEIGGQSYGNQSVYLFGRKIIGRMGRDDAVRPGDDVSIVGAGFKRSGGSRNYPLIGEAKEGTRLIIRNVPLALAESYVRDNDNAKIMEAKTA